MFSLCNFCCPVCKASLLLQPSHLRCPECDRAFPIVDGVPDFFISETAVDAIDELNKTWLDPEIVAARDTVYRLCAPELRGMAFCMDEIGRRTSAGARILEVGMGTGHFTRRLAEVVHPGAEIYAFDFSRPIIERARANTEGLANVTIFRANARGMLPFPRGSCEDGHFDIVFVRLAPLGAHGISKLLSAHKLLKAGGWLFEAGWAPHRYETPPTAWALEHNFESAEFHEWQYWRTPSAEERRATRLEMEHLAAQGSESAGQAVAALRREAATQGGPTGEAPVRKMTHEHLLIARKSPPS